MSRSEQILELCREPQSVEEIARQVGGSLISVRNAVYKLRAGGKLVNLNAHKGRTYAGLFLTAGAHQAPRYDASALVNAWSGRA